MFIDVAQDDKCGSSYDEAMDALSSLITQKSRADQTNAGLRFELMFDYVKVVNHKIYIY